MTAAIHGIKVGKVRMVRMVDGPLKGRVWLAHEEGEGMMCNEDQEKKLAECIEKFFQNEF